MLEGKKILVISPQPWGDIHVSKHHYALELAKRNNEVLFLNPLKRGRKFEVTTMTIRDSENLKIANAALPIPSFLRFKWRWFYNQLINFFSAKLADKLGGFDIVWCFDPNYFHDLKKFAPIAIYHPVDPITESFQIDCGRYADVIISVSHEILKTFKEVSTPRFMINHGVSGPFRSLAIKNYERIQSYVYQRPLHPKFGYVGNLLRKEIDWPLIFTIIGQHPDVEFNFWGPAISDKSNLAGDTSTGTRTNIEKLRAYPNVKLHGVVSSQDLPNAISKMDGFLLIYKYLHGQSDRSNSHKILEFFCTGKTLVSFRVKAYENHPELLAMPEHDSDDEIPALFSKVVDRIDLYNDRDHVEKRLSFALESSYEINLSKIEAILLQQKLDSTSVRHALAVNVS